MTSWFHDVRLAFRFLSKRPGLSAGILVSLALGLGANLTIFTFLNALFLRPLPVHEPERLVSIYGTDAANPSLGPLSHPNFLDLTRTEGVFSGAAAYQWISLSMTGGDRPERVIGQVVSPGFFQVLGVQAAEGQTFGAALAAEPVVVVSPRLCRRRFGGDPRQAVGRTLPLNGQSFTIVGVLPDRFNGIGAMGSAADVWVPLTFYDRVSAFRGFLDRRGTHVFGAVGRLAPGVELRRAEATVRTVGQRLEREYPDDNRNLGLTLRPLSQSVIDPSRRERFVLAGQLLLALSGLLLLVTCANVANLLLARAESRRREISVRLALGSGLGRLARQLLTESMLLALLGGALALVLARWTRDLLWSLRPPSILEGSFDLRLDWRVAVFAFGLAAAAGLLTGLAPVLQARRMDLMADLRSTGAATVRRRRRFSTYDQLVVVQVAFCLIAVAAGALFYRSLQSAWQADTGFATDKLLVMQFDLGAQGYDATRAGEFSRRVLDTVSTLPGLDAAALASSLPLSPFSLESGVRLESAASTEDTFVIRTTAVTPGYFRTLGISLLRGRDFTEADRPESPRVAVINQLMAERFWPSRDPVGLRVYHTYQDSWIEIVGVVANGKYGSLSEEPLPHLYLPLQQVPAPRLALHVRAARSPEDLLQTVRRQVQGLDPDLPLTHVQTVAQRLRDSLWAARMAAAILAAFSLVTLGLVSTGVYAVVAYSIRQRQREIAIRLALGGEHRDIRRLFLRRSMGRAAIGLGIGLALALALNRLAAGLLFGISPVDPLAFALALLLVAGIAWLATTLSILQAPTTDLQTVLRSE